MNTLIKPAIVLILNGTTTPTMSGGVTVAIETIKRFIADGYEVYIVTNPVAKTVFEYANVHPTEFILTENKYREVSNPLKIVGLYIKRAFTTKRTLAHIVSRLKGENKDVRILYASEAYCNLWSFSAIKGMKKILIINMLAPNPFWGYQQRFHVPSFAEIHYFLTNVLMLLIVKFYSTPKDLTLVAVARNIENGLRRFPVLREYPISTISIGIEESAFSIKKQIKMFDFVWIGRDHPQKGIGDLEKIIIGLKKRKPDFTIQIIGDVQKRMTEFVKQHDLELNVIIRGQLSGKEKYETLAKSKVFLFTSHYESFGIVVLENLLVGNVVVGYDIESSRENFSDFVLFVEEFSTPDFLERSIDALVQLPSDGELRNSIAFARNFSWGKAYDQYKQLLT